MIFSTFLQPSPSPPFSIFNILKSSPRSPLLLLSYSHIKSQTTAAAAWNRKGGVPAAAAAARDRVIDFGKYKGRMLGSLPSNYLKWVTKNLRAGDTEEWAKLADEVLADPIYRDRIEWELAEKVLSGGNESIRRNLNGNAVSELLEISQRFGWDNEDKEGWSRIDFGLLGTSKGGRIPRMKEISYSGYCKREEENNRIDRKNIRMVEEEGGGGRRKERRERIRSRRRTSVGNGGWATAEEEEDVVNNTSSRSTTTRTTMTMVVGGESGSGRRNPFPGREALLNKVHRQRDTRSSSSPNEY